MSVVSERLAGWRYAAHVAFVQFCTSQMLAVSIRSHEAEIDTMGPLQVGYSQSSNTIEILNKSHQRPFPAHESRPLLEPTTVELTLSVGPFIR